LTEKISLRDRIKSGSTREDSPREREKALDLLDGLVIIASMRVIGMMAKCMEMENLRGPTTYGSKVNFKTT